MRRMVSIAALAACCGGALAQARFELLPEGYFVSDVSADGSTVVGRFSIGGEDERNGKIFLYDVATKSTTFIDAAPGMQGRAISISGDGSTLVASMEVPNRSRIDLAEPYGTFSVQDLLAYLSAFRARSWAADITTPWYVINVQDLLAYLSGFRERAAPPDVMYEWAGTYTEETGWVALPLPGNRTSALACGGATWGSPYQISDDGTTVVGLQWSEICSAAGFVSEIGGETTPLLSPDPSSEDASRRVHTSGARASAVSGDGRVAAGFYQTNNRAPAAWVDGVFMPLDEAGVGYGEISAVSETGDLLIGTFEEGGMSVWEAEPQGGFTRAELIELKGRNGETCSQTGWASGLTPDGSMIVGGTLCSGRSAWVYREGVGAMSLEQYLVELGFNLNDPAYQIWNPNLAFYTQFQSYDAAGVSADGKVLAGTAQPEINFLPLPTRSWVLVTP